MYIIGGGYSKASGGKAETSCEEVGLFSVDSFEECRAAAPIAGLGCRQPRPLGAPRMEHVHAVAGARRAAATCTRHTLRVGNDSDDAAAWTRENGRGAAE